MLAAHGYGVIRKARISAKNGKPYVSILFTKQFATSNKSKSRTPPKVISGYQLGSEFTFVALSYKIEGVWSNTKINDRDGSGYDSVAPIQEDHSAKSGTLEIGLEHLLVPRNASRVQADASKSAHSMAFDKDRDRQVYDGRGQEEKVEEQKRQRKQRKQRR